MRSTADSQPAREPVRKGTAGNLPQNSTGLTSQGKPERSSSLPWPQTTTRDRASVATNTLRRSRIRLTRLSQRSVPSYLGWNGSRPWMTR